MNLPLQGRVALVTGAGRRLGRAVALRLAEEGGDVVVHYRSSQPEAQETVRQIEKLGRRATAVGADLGQVSEIKRVFDEAGKQFGRLDILVNSAANFLPASMVSTTEEIWDSSLDTNLRAPFFCAQDRKSTRLNSSHGYISYAVFCLKKKKKKTHILLHRLSSHNDP